MTDFLSKMRFENLEIEESKTVIKTIKSILKLPDISVDFYIYLV